jgi:GxxExxY protein
MKTVNELTFQINGAAMEVHRELGVGLLESVYEAALCQELLDRGLAFERQVPVVVTYKGKLLECGFRADLIVGGQVIVELKAVEQLQPLHEAQLLNYLKLARLQVGLLINFNVPVLKNGIRRIVNNFSENSAISAPSAVN